MSNLDSRGRWLEHGLNLLSLGLVVFIGFTALSQRFQSDSANTNLIQVGEPVSLDVDWTKSSRTLVVALSVGCRFCADSAPFYKDLMSRATEGNWRAVAVFPQSTQSAKTYMNSHGYQIPEVRQVDLPSIGVTGTPTLLLVDDRGKVLQQWVGALSKAEEADVAGYLGIGSWAALDRAGAIPGAQVPPSPLVGTTELRALLATPEKLNLVDVRERTAFAKRRLERALNIPVDELAVRAPHELDAEKTTLLYCNFSASCAANGAPSLCSNAVAQLGSVGVGNVRLIRDPLVLLGSSGVRVTGMQTP